VARQRRHTPAGTRSAFARISWRSVVNSEIVPVATEATGGWVGDAAASAWRSA
jgi:hypothetical protein